MWDVQDRDGHCEVGTGQRSGPLKQGNDEENDDDFTERGRNIVSFFFFLFISCSTKCLSREQCVGSSARESHNKPAGCSASGRMPGT
jgi:hypothetical protein